MTCMCMHVGSESPSRIPLWLHAVSAPVHIQQFFIQREKDAEVLDDTEFEAAGIDTLTESIAQTLEVERETRSSSAVSRTLQLRTEKLAPCF
eukprot:3466623-Rhodomonas_salina.3